jgi:hypothetical protein
VSAIVADLAFSYNTSRESEDIWIVLYMEDKMLDANRIHPDILYSPNEVAKLEGCCIALVYRRVAAGEYPALKDGHSTRILGSAILARRSAKLVPASYKPQGARFDTDRQTA